MTTRFLQLAHHTVTGVTLSDTTFRFVTLKQHGDSVLPEKYAELQLPEKCFENGILIDKSRFAAFLKNTKKAYSLDRISLVVTSSQVQTWSVSARGDAVSAIRTSVEKEFSLPLKDVIYEHKAIVGNGIATVHQVTAMPKNVSQDIVNAFKSAKLTVTTIEPVGHAVRRAVLTPGHHNALLINIDDNTTSLTFIAQGKISQTQLIAFGDDMLTAAIMKSGGVVKETAEQLKRDQGMLTKENSTVFDAIVDDCATLVGHINDAYIAWRKEHDTLPPVHSVYLTGAGSIVRGLDEYIAAGLRLPVQEGNVWTNCLSFDEHIPSLSKDLATRYAAAIGVALTGGDTVNLLPYSHKQSLRRKRVASVSAKILLSFALGIIVGFCVSKVIAHPVVHAKILDVLHKIAARW